MRKLVHVYWNYLTVYDFVHLFSSRSGSNEGTEHQQSSTQKPKIETHSTSQVSKTVRTSIDSLDVDLLTDMTNLVDENAIGKDYFVKTSPNCPNGDEKKTVSATENLLQSNTNEPLDPESSVRRNSILPDVKPLSDISVSLENIKPGKMLSKII